MRKETDMKKTLVILAAGIGSRFGGGVKQLTPVGPNGEVIIDYSIHDAIRSGFEKIVFIIRRDIEADFRAVIGERTEQLCARLGVEVCYAFQELNDLPAVGGKPFALPEGRTKPWGTGHAVLACRELLKEPFCVINADDYYGKNGFAKAAEFLEQHPEELGLIAYVLKNTLSDHGGVTRGICRVENGSLIGIDETHNIEKKPCPAGGFCAKTGERTLDPESLVSMNFWCFPANMIQELRRGFPDFLAQMEHPLKDEYLLPIIADGMLRRGTPIRVLPTDDHWFGVTYQEDREIVRQSFAALYAEGVYQTPLFADFVK